MKIALRKRCPICGSRRLYKDPPEWWMHLILAGAGHYGCDRCDCAFVLLRPWSA
ncbi:MAG: hypothetical protein WCN95_09740 [bacterium]